MDCSERVIRQIQAYMRMSEDDTQTLLNRVKRKEVFVCGYHFSGINHKDELMDNFAFLIQ